MIRTSCQKNNLFCTQKNRISCFCCSVSTTTTKKTLFWRHTKDIFCRYNDTLFEDAKRRESLYRPNQLRACATKCRGSLDSFISFFSSFPLSHVVELSFHCRLQKSSLSCVHEFLRKSLLPDAFFGCHSKLLAGEMIECQVRECF